MPAMYNEGWYAKSECTPKCLSHCCVRELNAVITKANIHQLKDYVWSHCPNSCQRHDNGGKYPLHVAASCGKIEILDWLVTTFQCDLNVQDKESGWTPLHSAIYYGRLSCAILLIEYGANMWIRDKDGLTAMDITMLDCTPWVKSLEFSRQTYEMPSVLSASDPSEVYTWGSNDNFVLGHGNPRGGKLPEPLEYFTKRRINIKVVAMAKFHTVFISAGGNAYSCGHGEGGRLGNGRQDVCLEPTEVSLSPSVKISTATAAVNHTLLVTDTGQLYSCGLNKCHVLGNTSSNDRELTPVKVQGGLRSVKVIGCAAAKLHSVVWTDNHAVFTFGTNAGQLGHSKTDLYVRKPRQVSGVYNEDDEVMSVHACDSATVIATRQGTVYLLQKYVCRKIISKQLDITKIQVGGGKLDTSVLARIDQRLHSTHTEIKDDSLRVLVCKKSGDLLSWSKAHGTLDRCKFDMKQPLLVKDVILCNHGHTALLVTNTGQAFMTKFGHWKAPKPPKRHSSIFLSKGYDSCLDMLDADAVQELILEQISGVFRAHSGTLSPKGKSGALLQCEPCNFVTDIPMIRESSMRQNMKNLFDGMHESDGICDMVAVATDANGNQLLAIPCHKYMVASKSAKLRKMIQEKSNDCQNGGDDVCFQKTLDAIIFRECDPVVLKNVLQLIYCENCDLLRHGFKPPRLSNGTHRNEVAVLWSDVNSNQVEAVTTIDGKLSAFAAYQNQPKSKKNQSSKNEIGARNALSQFKLLAKSLGLNSSLFNQFSIQDGVITMKSAFFTHQDVKLSYDRHKLRELCDIQLECCDNVVLEAHKCILVARVEFFQSMLFSQWAETASSVSKIPIHSKVFGHVLDYVYRDDEKVLEPISSVEMLCDVMAAADQMLLERLKDIAEVQVASMLNLKNVAAIIEFSSVFNCEQLFKTCQQFICQNLPSLMNTPLFYSVDYKILEECEEFYRSNISYVFLRIITPSSEAPPLPEIELESDDISPSLSNSSAPENYSITARGHASPQKKKGIVGRRRSSAGKRRSISKVHGITLSELLAQKDENVDSLLHRIATTSNVKLSPLESHDEEFEDSSSVARSFPEKPDNLQSPVDDKSKSSKTEDAEVTSDTSKSSNRTSNRQTSPVSPAGRRETAVASFRDIMASQAQNRPRKQPLLSQGVVWGPQSVPITLQSPPTQVIIKPKKLSQKQRKRLEQEAMKKHSEKVAVPNAWGVAPRPSPSNRSFWDVMREQSSTANGSGAVLQALPTGVRSVAVQGNERYKK